MILKIDPKFIEDTVKRGNNHGYVYIRYGEFQPRYEKRVVKEPIPIIGKIFPFLTRKVVKNVITGQDLVMREEKVDNIRAMGVSASKMLKSQLEEMPYRRIVKLDEKIYGDLYVGDMGGQKYNIVTKEGVVIGQYKMEEGYYYPSMNGLLPKEASSSMDRHQDCTPIGLEEIVSSYVAKNPDSKKFIPQNLYERFPDLSGEITKAEQRVKDNSGRDFSARGPHLD